MANVIEVPAENPDQLLNAGMYGAGAIIRLQSAALEAGPFANESTAAIVAGTRLYTLFDQDGISTTWYRTRYENAGGTVVSDWSAAFQAGDETGGLICSVYDVEQRVGTLSENEKEIVLDIIGSVTAAIEGYCGRWFVPRPLSGTRTYRVHTRAGHMLRFPKGIHAITSLGIASTDQPESGGTYTPAGATDYWLEPPEAERDAGWPGTAIRLRPTGSTLFYTATFGAELDIGAGWSAVPADIQEIGIEATIRHFIGKQTAAPAIAVGPSGAVTMLRSLSPEARGQLDWYRLIPV